MWTNYRETGDRKTVKIVLRCYGLPEIAAWLGVHENTIKKELQEVISIPIIEFHGLV